MIPHHLCHRVKGVVIACHSVVIVHGGPALEHCGEGSVPVLIRQADLCTIITEDFELAIENIVQLTTESLVVIIQFCEVG
jgi:hypothetical protein